jgi:hypothetical protein
MQACEAHPKIRKAWPELAELETKEDFEEHLSSLKETEIRELFDGIKQKFGLRVFGKGYLYRIVGKDEIHDPANLSEDEKRNGIKSKKEAYVPYDKGDKEGNRWYLETANCINWNYDTVQFLQKSESARYQNPQFYFHEGFCWNESLNPNSIYVKCRKKARTVNDVSSMSLYDQSGLGDDFLVAVINSFLGFKILRENLNSTVKIQINDIRRLPIFVPEYDVLQKIRKFVIEAIELKQNQPSDPDEKNAWLIQMAVVEQKIEKEILGLFGLDAKQGLRLAQQAFSQEDQEADPVGEEEQEE